MIEITNPSAELEAGKRYLVFFKVAGISESGLRALSDQFNVRAEFLNRAGSALSSVTLEGTTVRRTGPDSCEFIALVKVHGTPLLVIATPLVLVIAALAGAAVLAYFVKAVLVEVGGGLGDALRSIGRGVEETGGGLGSGLQYGLPAFGIAAAALGIAVLFGAVTLSRR